MASSRRGVVSGPRSVVTHVRRSIGHAARSEKTSRNAAGVDVNPDFLSGRHPGPDALVSRGLIVIRARELVVGHVKDDAAYSIRIASALTHHRVIRPAALRDEFRVGDSEHRELESDQLIRPTLEQSAEG